MINNYKFLIKLYKENKMNLFEKIVNKVLVFEKEPQKIGLTQLKDIAPVPKAPTPSLKNKNVKLSDLMRRAS